MKSQTLDRLTEQLASEGVPEYFTQSLFQNPEKLKSVLNNLNMDEEMSEMSMRSLYDPTSQDENSEYQQSKAKKVRSIRAEDTKGRRTSPTQVQLQTMKQAINRLASRREDPNKPSLKKFVFGVSWSYSRSSIESLKRSELFNHRIIIASDNLDS